MKENDQARVHARVIKERGLPPFFQDGRNDWETALSLPTLSRLRSGLPLLPPFTFRFGDLEPADVPVTILTKDRWPSEMQFLNCLWLQEMDETFSSFLLEAIFDAYPTIRSRYDFIAEEDMNELLPDLPAPSAVSQIVRLNGLSIHAVDHASTPYLGANFACAWDDEHGLGVLSCGTELLEVGTGEVAFDGNLARAHRKELLEKLKQQ